VAELGPQTKSNMLQNWLGQALLNGGNYSLRLPICGAGLLFIGPLSTLLNSLRTPTPIAIDDPYVSRFVVLPSENC